MTIRTDVPAEEADALAAEKLGRVLYRRTEGDGEVFCTIQMFDAPVEAEAEDAPKKRGRPPKSASDG